MASNFLQPGCVLELTAPTGGVVSGTPILIGSYFVIPLVTAAATVRFNGQLDGVWTLPKTTSEVWAEGESVYWDAANSKLSTDPSLGLPVGAVHIAALSADTSAAVRLNGTSVGGRPLTIRKRFTIAQVNAGATLLAAIPGAQYRMVDATAIAIGGAAAAVTTVDILSQPEAGRVRPGFAHAEHRAPRGRRRCGRAGRWRLIHGQ